MTRRLPMQGGESKKKNQVEEKKGEKKIAMGKETIRLCAMVGEKKKPWLKLL